MTLWIVSEYGAERDKFFVHPGINLTRTEISNRWSKAKRVFVLNSSELPLTPCCPSLSTLIFSEAGSSQTTPICRTNNPNAGRAKIPYLKMLFMKAEEGHMGASSSSQPLIPIPGWYPMPSSPDAGDVFQVIFRLMPTLRVLDLSSFSLYDLPEVTQQILALRYLGGAGTHVLPPNVGNLINLEILDLRSWRPSSKSSSSMNQTLLTGWAD